MLWPFNKAQSKVVCFFCKIEVSKKDSFELKYKSVDGEGAVTMCPMCAGMMDDMSRQTKELYSD